MVNLRPIKRTIDHKFKVDLYSMSAINELLSHLNSFLSNVQRIRQMWMRLRMRLRIQMWIWMEMWMWMKMKMISIEIAFMQLNGWVELLNNDTYRVYKSMPLQAPLLHYNLLNRKFAGLWFIRASKKHFGLSVGRLSCRKFHFFGSQR